MTSDGAGDGSVLEVCCATFSAVPPVAAWFAASHREPDGCESGELGEQCKGHLGFRLLFAVR
jgi:hypothetical protein